LVSSLTLAFIADLPRALGSGDNWFAGWTYRERITVQPATGAGTNYQLPVTVYKKAAPVSSLQWYSMSAPSNPISGNPTDQHGFDVVHTTNIVQCNASIDGSTWTYLAYDSDSEGNNIYLYYSDNVTGPWASYSLNPILASTNGSFRTPSVVYTSGVFEMFLNNLNSKDVVRWTSSDGINFTYNETVLTSPDDVWTNPFVWLNPNDGNWYLFWVDGNNNGDTWAIYARSSVSITSLGSATDTLVLTSNSTGLRHMACPTIMYRDGHYWLLCEAEPLDDGPWEVCAFVSTSVTSGYAECPNSPILTNDEACPQIFIADDNVSCYLFDDQNSNYWYQEMRTVNPLALTVAVTTNGHCLDNFGDLRFTASDGATPLNYWIQSVSVGNQATFLVRDPEDLSSSNSTIYIYYGNSGATTTSNGADTLLFFDNFSADSSIDWTNTWQSSAQSLYSLSGGNLVCSQASGGSSLIQTQASFSGGFCAETLVEETSSSGQAYLDMESSALTYTGEDNEILDYYLGTYDVFLNGASLKVSSTMDTTDFFTLVHMCPSSGSATGQIWLGSTQEISFSNVPSYATAHVGILQYDPGVTLVQWVYVRKYVNPEPYVSAVGPEERQKYTLTVAVSPVGSGSVRLNNTGPSYDYGDAVQLTAVPSVGWSFVGWSGDLFGSLNPATVIITGNMVVNASFSQNQYTLTTNIFGTGLVNLNNTGPYHYGDSAQLSAVPAAGWSFQGWSGDLTGSANPATLVMDNDKTVTATFTQDQYTLTVNVVGQGSVGTNPEQATYTWGTNVTLTANAGIRWTFADWSGDASATINPITVNVTANMTVTATFTQLLEHDVAITNVTTSKTGSVPMPIIGQNLTATVNVTVANNGDYDESTVNVTAYATQTVYYNTTTQSWTPIPPILQTPIAIDSVLLNLDVGQNATVTLAWNTTGFAYGNYTLSAYVWPVPGETNMTNNNFVGGAMMVTIPGDINGDGTVDIYDAILQSAAFNSSPDSPNWNPNADINCDGIVDIYDAIIMSSYFGQSIP